MSVTGNGSAMQDGAVVGCSGWHVAGGGLCAGEGFLVAIVWLPEEGFSIGVLLSDKGSLFDKLKPESIQDDKKLASQIIFNSFNLDSGI